MSSKTNGFAQGTVLKVAYSMLGLTSSVILARIGLNILKPKRLVAADFFVFLGFTLHVVMCSLYISVSPYMQRVYGVVNGEIQPYAELNQEKVIMAKMVFTAFCIFWMTLWSIKFSLLLLYRRLLTGITRRYTLIWWAICGICLITFAGNYVMYFRSCGTISGFWNGGCNSDAAQHAQLASLYYSFAVDTSTNLMIMALPIRLTWNLQMPRSKKVAILLLFASGLVCILFACLRVAQVATNAARPESRGHSLDPTWLAIWGMVECSIAVIIGCCPAFAILINAFRAKVTYDSGGYRKQTESNTDKSGSNRIQLRTFGGGVQAKRERGQRLGLEIWADAHGSQEELRADHDGILVSTTVTQKEGTATVYQVR